MRQDHLIRHTPSPASPRHPPPPPRVYTPTLESYERFLRECVALACGDGTPRRARDGGPSPVRHDHQS